MLCSAQAAGDGACEPVDHSLGEVSVHSAPALAMSASLGLSSLMIVLRRISGNAGAPAVTPPA